MAIDPETPIAVLAEQFQELDAHITRAAHEAFHKFSSAGLIREERHENGEYVMVPIRSYEYDSHTVESDHIDIRGKAYAGCGEYDHHSIQIPFPAFEDLDQYITEQKAAEREHQILEAKIAEEERVAADEKADRKRYEELHAKFGGQK